LATDCAFVLLWWHWIVCLIEWPFKSGRKSGVLKLNDHSGMHSLLGKPQMHPSFFGHLFDHFLSNFFDHLEWPWISKGFRFEKKDFLTRCYKIFFFKISSFCLKHNCFLKFLNFVNVNFSPSYINIFFINKFFSIQIFCFEKSYFYFIKIIFLQKFMSKIIFFLL